MNYYLNKLINDLLTKKATGQLLDGHIKTTNSSNVYKIKVIYNEDDQYNDFVITSKIGYKNNDFVVYNYVVEATKQHNNRHVLLENGHYISNDEDVINKISDAIYSLI